MKDFVGIDIGAGSIKVVSVGKDSNGYWLRAIGEAKNTAEDWLKESKGKQTDAIASSLKLLLSDLKIKEHYVVASLPEEDVVSRLIRLPPLKEEEIKEALKFEAETFIPYPLDQVSIDYEVIEKDETGKLLVFAIAAKNDLIKKYVDVFKSAKLELIALESMSVAIRRVIAHAVSGTNSVMVVDLGARYSNITIIKDGFTVFSRVMSMGGDSLTRAISINLGLDMASAEEYKKAYGMKEMELEGKIKASILPVFASMAEEIRRAMVSYREEWNKPLDLLVLSGGGANMPGLAEELTKILGIEVQIIQPFVKINSDKIVTPINLAVDGCRFGLAAGLALRGQ